MVGKHMNKTFQFDCHEKRTSKDFLGIAFKASVHIVLGSHMRPCKPCALNLTIANSWVRF